MATSLNGYAVKLQAKGQSGLTQIYTASAYYVSVGSRSITAANDGFVSAKMEIAHDGSGYGRISINSTTVLSVPNRSVWMVSVPFKKGDYVVVAVSSAERSHWAFIYY